jgi:glycosyltransferase involved in cell wall biosynthesis
VRHVLLNLPNLDGHRQIYCRELCEYFLSRDLRVTVATDLTGLGEYSQLEMLLQDPRVRFVSDTWSRQRHAATQLQELGAAAREAGADVVFLGEADLAHGLLCAQIVRPHQRLPGRRVGLFIRSTNYVHQVKRPQTGRIGGFLERGILATYKYYPPSLAQPRLFHELVSSHFAVLDAALCLDEVFVAEHSRRYGWLPDVAVASAEAESVGSDVAAWEAQVKAFVAAHDGRPMVAYIGTPQPRRGYEELLELACDVDGCFLHCGKLHGSRGSPQQEPAARRALLSRSAILESGCFYQSFETARLTLRAARCVVLPYRRSHLGSSGVMLQALMAGRPVLVPDQGLIAWRVRNFGLGLTFIPGDRGDMRYKFSLMQAMPAEFFSNAIDEFLAYFSKAQFELAMDRALGLRQTGPRIPFGDHAPISCAREE